MGIGFMWRVVVLWVKKNGKTGSFIRINTLVQNEGVVSERGMCVPSIGQQRLRWTQSITEGIYVPFI